MADHPAYDRKTKRLALGIWILAAVVLLAVILSPLLYWWDPIAERGPMIMVIVLGLLAWALFNWWKLVAIIFGRIRSLPEE